MTIKWKDIKCVVQYSWNVFVFVRIHSKWYSILQQSSGAFCYKQIEYSIIQTISGEFLCIFHRNIKLKIEGKPRCRWLNKSLRLPALQEWMHFFPRFIRMRSLVSIFFKMFTFRCKRYFPSCFSLRFDTHSNKNNMFCFVNQYRFLFLSFRFFTEHLLVYFSKCPLQKISNFFLCSYCGSMC